jgi:TorA-specific chaperone
MSPISDPHGTSPNPEWDASIVEWLSGIFVAPPSIETVEGYRRRIGEILFEALEDEPGCRPGIQRMRSALNLQASATEVAHLFGRAFTQLFDGIAGSRSVSLYESAYVSPSGLLFQAPVGRIEKLLRQSDVSINVGFCEPSDHLSIELALLARLMRHETDPCAQGALLDDHLLVWLPAFADQCHACDQTGFYAGAAQVLKVFLESHRAHPRFQRSAQPETGASPCHSH